MTARERSLARQVAAQAKVIEEQEKTILSLRSQVTIERLRRNHLPRNRTPLPAILLVPGRVRYKGPTCTSTAPAAH